MSGVLAPNVYRKEVGYANKTLHPGLDCATGLPHP